MTFTLIVLLYFGTPEQREIQIAERMTWADCMERAFAELNRRGRGHGVRCQRQDVRAQLRT